MGRHGGIRPHLRRRLAASFAASLAAILVPALVAAHPLGNFTINHYAGIRVEPEVIRLDIVIDQAEIPAFQARQTLDLDGDGTVSAAETETGRASSCASLASSLDLRVGSERQVLTPTEAGLSFPPGAGGLTTMRLVCGFERALAAPLTAGTTISFADRSFAERIGWREIVIEGSGLSAVAGDGGAFRASGASARLTVYPEDLLTRPLADGSVDVRVAAIGGATLPAFDIPDASPLAGRGTSDPALSPAPTAPTASAGVPTSAVPGGVSASELPSIFRVADLTPWVLLLSLGTAAVLGAGHALTPGHGKTLMAAYLVGTRGTMVHAIGLGLSVTLSHTLGILALTAVIVGAQGVLAPDVVIRTAPIVAAVSIVAIGGWMLWSEVRRRRAATTPATVQERAHEHGPAHAHPHPHEHEHDPHEPEHAGPATSGEHSHGGARHSHLPPAGAAITWRSLFALGLAGGLIPSTSALLILLGSIAAGRPAFGFVLVVAFGLGMALVMAGIGIAMVVARGRLERVDAGSALGRVGAVVPLVAAVLVFGLGVYLTFQAVAGTPVL